MVSRVLCEQDFWCNSSRRVSQHCCWIGCVSAVHETCCDCYCHCLRVDLLDGYTPFTGLPQTARFSVLQSNRNSKNLDPIEVVHHSTTTSVYRQ